MKKKVYLLIGVLLILGVSIWWMISRKADLYQVRQGIPANAVFVAETPSFNSIRDKLYQNKIWKSLKEYPYFETYQANLNQIDSLCTAYPGLRKWLTDRPFAVSCHLLTDDYDFLYVCDLGKLNVIQAFEGIIEGLLEKARLVKKGELTEIRMDDLKMYYAIRANLLFFSFSESLVVEGIQACQQHTVEKEQKEAGDIQLYFNHHQLEKFSHRILGESGNRDSSAWETTYLALSLKDKALYFKGETYPSRNHFSLFSALNLVEGNESRLKEVVSSHIAAYVSICYNSLEELENILLENYKINNLKDYTEYERTLKRLNKFLGVDLRLLFTSWMGNEIAVIKPAVDKENRLDNLVLAVRSKDIDLAKDQLNYLKEQINRKTPVRFREMEYNGHTISYLSLKGFFQLFLGSRFRKFDRPYYTFLGEYVVFSNSASTLASLIKDYSLGNTLEYEATYNVVMEQLDNKNNVYGYISSPEIYKYLYHSLPSAVKTEFLKNKGAFESFESVGFVMKNVGSAYETRLIASHNVNASWDYELKERNRELEELADRIQSGYYRVVIPDSIAISTRGKYAYSTGELFFTGCLSNGDPDGIWNITDKQGKEVAQYVYRQGKEEGETRFFYPDGVTCALVRYQEGQIISYQEFFEDGTLKMELEYNRGLRHGKVRFYYSTGHLAGEGKYKKGKRTGTWTYYRVTGETEKKIKF